MGHPHGGVIGDDAELQRRAIGHIHGIAPRTPRSFGPRFANPYITAERGYVDEVIVPRQTRRKLIASLRMLAGKRATTPPKKHGNIPL